MDIQRKRDFLINLAYWTVIAAGAYLGLQYLVPVCVPCLIGLLLGGLVIRISRAIRCPNRIVRILLALLIYGVIGLLVALAGVKGASAVTGLVKWLPEVYDRKLLPFVNQVYIWIEETIYVMDPALITALESVLQSVLASLKSLITALSSAAVGLVSGLATGIPNLILSLLTMIFSTVFLVSDHDRIAQFARENTPGSVKKIVSKVKVYLTDTLLVVIRSYLLIMLLTFTELTILFSIFGINDAVLKASLIAVMDIMPILGTGGIMIPWAVVSLVLGNFSLGLKLLLIYGIVTVVRNYVEPKIVGAQLGLHPIVTLVSMFVGLRVFGFWGLFGLPVSISFVWKQRTES